MVLQHSTKTQYKILIGVWALSILACTGPKSALKNSTKLPFKNNKGIIIIYSLSPKVGSEISDEDSIFSNIIYSIYSPKFDSCEYTLNFMCLKSNPMKSIGTTVKKIRKPEDTLELHFKLGHEKDRVIPLKCQFQIMEKVKDSVYSKPILISAEINYESKTWNEFRKKYKSNDSQ
jgi:hypothetical protein